MKNSRFFLLVCILCTTPLLSEAIIQKDSRLISGSINTSNLTSLAEGEGFTISNFSINPVYGRFFRKNIVFGPFFRYEYQNQDGFNEPATSLDLGGFGRLYTGVNLFFELSFRYDRQQSQFGNRSHGSWGGVGMGYTVFLTESFAMEPRVFADFGVFGDNSNLVRTGFTLGLTGFLRGSEQE